MRLAFFKKLAKIHFLSKRISFFQRNSPYYQDLKEAFFQNICIYWHFKTSHKIYFLTSHRNETMRL